MQREHISANKIALLPNSIDLAHFSSPDSQQRVHSRQKLGLSPSAPVFAAVANLRPVKRLATLIEAAAIVHATLPGARFLILGEGNDRSALATQIEALHLEGVVRLEGAQPDVRPWLRAADVGVLTSESESSSNAVLEYMAMGLPTVVSDIPANRELVEGLFFPVGNAHQLAEHVIWLWKHPEIRAAMGENNRKLAAGYDAKAVAQQAEQYYW